MQMDGYPLSTGDEAELKLGYLFRYACQKLKGCKKEVN